MQAIRYHGQKDIRLETVDVPICGQGQVKVKPAFVGICGSDLHEYSGGPAFFPTKPHPITGEKLPIIIGHEFSGTIEEVGPNVLGLGVGQRVAVLPPFYDHSCGACQRGMLNCCESIGAIGCSGRGGGLSEHIVIEQGSAYLLPESVSLEVGALVEPLAVAWHAIDTAQFRQGDSIFILGAGPIGVALIQCLKARGCHRIVVSEVSSHRKRFAEELGADHVLDPTTDDIVARVRDICQGEGADIVFDAAGVQAGLNQGILALRARGTLVNIALWEKPPTFDVNSLLFREKVYRGTFGYMPDDFRAVIDAIASGKLRPEKMITGTVGLDEVEEKGFKALINNKDSHVKILVEVARSS